jgi:hypothetical protein
MLNEEMIQVTIRDEGWGKEMFGTFGVLPSECHEMFEKYEHFNIEVYKDYDRYECKVSQIDYKNFMKIHEDYEIERSKIKERKTKE